MTAGPPLHRDELGHLLEIADQGLQLAMRRAAWIGQLEPGPPTISFSSLWLGLITGNDAIARLMEAVNGALDLKLEPIAQYIREQAPTGASFDAARIAAARTLAVEQLPQSRIQCTPSATSLLRFARDQALARGEGSSTQYVLAAFLFGPNEGHHETFEEWGLDLMAWGGLAVEAIVDRHPERAQSWLELATMRSRPLSGGINEAEVWASAYLQLTAPDARAVNADALFAGILLDGLNYTQLNVASAWLANELKEPLKLLGLPSVPETTSTPLGAYTADAIAILGRAAAIAAVADPEDDHLRMRHVIFAFLTRPLSPLATEVLSRAKTTVPKLRRSFLAWVSSWNGVDRKALYERFIPGEGEYCLAGYDNDDAHGADRLNITREVNALAAVLASSKVTPPLSVGLFGDWGSGKSFFMHHLRSSIKGFAERAKVAGEPQNKALFCSEIIQIEFNAWQYVDGSLWASLATHIFDSLNDELQKESKPTIEKYAVELQSLKERNADLTREKTALVAASASIEKDIAEQQERRLKRQLELSDFTKRILRDREGEVTTALANATEQLGLKDAELTIDEARAEHTRLKYFGGRFAAWLRIARENPSVAVAAALLLLVPAGVTYFLATQLASDVTSSLSAATAFAGSVVAWVRSLNSKVEPGIQAFDRALDGANSMLARKRELRTVEENAALEAQHELSKQEAALAKEQRLVLEHQAIVEAEIAALKDGQSFKKLVLERAASSDYRKERGLVASIHRDFKELSKRLASRADAPHVERIVLYIDDLDRCPPDRVVEVLQAVHLILSLPLFVVVVAVDSTWLQQSLEAYYRKHFKHRTDWESKPQHYLEKIIQIPFTIPRMKDDGFGQLVGNILSKHVEPEHALPPDEHDPGKDKAPESKRPTGDDRAASNANPNHEPDDAIGEITPNALLLKAAERDFAKTLAELMPSPRAAKRFTNIYRIVRATLPQSQIEAFASGDRYKATQLLLATLIGCPSLAKRVFRLVGDTGATSADVVNALSSTVARELPHEQARAKWLGERLSSLEWSAVTQAAESVAKYSIDSGRAPQHRPSRAVHEPAP